MATDTFPVTTTVVVEVRNLVTGAWVAYPFVGSRPRFTGVQSPSGDTVWIVNSEVRFPR